jgi:hypothetical protein
MTIPSMDGKPTAQALRCTDCFAAAPLASWHILRGQSTCELSLEN